MSMEGTTMSNETKDANVSHAVNGIDDSADDTILVTGGAGFIGSNFIRHAMVLRPNWRIINLDALTYAGNAANLADMADA